MSDKNNKLPACGIIMPISSAENCSAEHWLDVLGILKDVCSMAGFAANLVSEADDIGIIHNRIIENIYSSDIVICDVSCKNANVMFELGMRLAFDKPTIIIKDDLTGYSFDTSLIEHLEYPRDLRFTSIIKFKENLSNKLKATHLKATTDPNYSTFLKNFGKYKIAHLEDREVTSDTFILKSLDELKEEVRILRNNAADNKTNSYIKTATDSSYRQYQTDKMFVKTTILDYLKKNNLSWMEDTTHEYQAMVIDLEKSFEFFGLTGDRHRLRKLIKEVLAEL